MCLLYGAKTKSVNEARYEIFCTASGAEQSMPPTKDALTEHLKRANYQCAIWRRALVPKNQAPTPVGRGWKEVDGKLRKHWMNQPAAPAHLLRSVSCQCKSSKCSGRCSCHLAKLPCTDLCACTGCDNTLAEAQDTGNVIGSDEEDL